MYASCIFCVGIGEKRSYNSPSTILMCIVVWNGAKVGLIEAYKPICANLKRLEWSEQMISILVDMDVDDTYIFLSVHDSILKPIICLIYHL